MKKHVGCIFSPCRPAQVSLVYAFASAAGMGRLVAGGRRFAISYSTRFPMGSYSHPIDSKMPIIFFIISKWPYDACISFLLHAGKKEKIAFALFRIAAMGVPVAFEFSVMAIAHSQAFDGCAARIDRACFLHGENLQQE